MGVLYEVVTRLHVSLWRPPREVHDCCFGSWLAGLMTWYLVQDKACAFELRDKRICSTYFWPGGPVGIWAAHCFGPAVLASCCLRSLFSLKG